MEEENSEFREPMLECYDHSKPIESGSFGTVHLYTIQDRHKADLRYPRKMAVKSVIIGNQKQMKEIELCMKIEHKNIIAFYGVEKNTPTSYMHIKMEFGNLNLKDFQTDILGGAVDPDHFLHYSLQMAKGLAYLHNEGVVHRDIKPQNILALWPDEVQDVKTNHSSVILKYCDFGVSRDDLEGTMTATIAGSRIYFAPEIEDSYFHSIPFRGNYERADIFSLGLVFHQLLFNFLPAKTKKDGKCQELVIDSSAREEFVGLLKLMLPCNRKERIDANLVVSLLKNKNMGKTIERLLKERLAEQQERSSRSAQTSQEIVINSTPQAKPVLDMQDHGKISLLKAAEDGNLNEAVWLLDNGDDVNRINKERQTPLYLACENGHSKMAEVLIDRGADVDMASKLGNTPLYVASDIGYAKLVQLLIERGAEVNKGCREGWTALHIACSAGHMDVIKLLVASGADVNKGNDYDATPISSACSNDRLPVAEFLIESGARVNATNKQDGRTPLHAVCRFRDSKLPLLLVENGAEVDKADGDGRTPLSEACRFNNLSAARLLIERGAEVNSADKAGDTPLHKACAEGYASIAELLLDEGADEYARNTAGRTPVELLSDARNGKEIRLLFNGRRRRPS